jgi:hypothetical protein
MPSTRPRSCAAACLSVAAGLATYLSACTGTDATLTKRQELAIADTIVNLIKSAYDLKRPDVVTALLSLYGDSGRVISASGGQVVASRDSLASGIHSFWTYVGSNMKDPQWSWGKFFVDVLANDAVVVTTTYRVPHHTPAGEPHVIAGAWTAVFARRHGKWMIVQEHLSDVPPEVLAATAAPSTPATEPQKPPTTTPRKP